MADNDKSKLRYDDFVSNVQPDPAKPEATIMLSGFVGHGPEGHARIYPDPTLGTWYDVPEGDVVHSTPIADSKLGGSYVWVRASADIKPGNAAPQANEAPQAAAAGINPTPATHCFVCDPPKAAPAIQPTPTVQTHCFICPPHTQSIHCPTQPVLCDTMQQPTPATRCFICPPLHTQQVLCPTNPVACNIQPTPTAQTHFFICPPTLTQQAWCPTQAAACNTQPVVCGIVPPTLACQQRAAGPQPEAVMAGTPPTMGCGQHHPQAAMAAAGPPNTSVEACSPLCVTPMCPTAAPGCWTAPSGLCAQAPHAAAAGMQPSPAVTACVQPTPATQSFICATPVWTVNVCDTFICNMQAAPHKTSYCTIPPNCPAQTGLVPCPTQPGSCTLPVQCYQNTWFACQQGGGQQHGAAMAAAAPPSGPACGTAPLCPSILCFTESPNCWTPSGICAPAPQAAMAGMHPTPFCTIPPNCPAQTGLVPCPTQPGACTLPVQCYQNTWFACQQGGGQQHGAAMAAAAPFTLPPWVCGVPTQNCQHGGGQPQPDAAWTMLATRCICNPQPAAAAGGPGQTAATPCTALQVCMPTIVTCPTVLGVCPTVATGCWTAPSGLCAFAPAPNGVFTPFGR